MTNCLLHFSTYIETFVWLMAWNGYVIEWHAMIILYLPLTPILHEEYYLTPIIIIVISASLAENSQGIKCICLIS